MNILYICHRIPYPPNKGDKIRSFNEIKHLSKKHNISLACLVDNKKDLIHIDELKKYCTTVDYDVINPKWRKIKSLMYLFSRRPLSVLFFYSKKLQKAIDYRASSIKFDAVFAYSSPMAEYVFKSKSLSVHPEASGQDVRDVRTIRTSVMTKQFEHFEQAKRLNSLNSPRLIMDFVDVDSDKWNMYSKYSSFPKSLIYKNEWKRLMKYEKRVGETFDTSVFVSDAEVKLFKSFAPDVKAVSVPNGVDFAYFSTVQPDNSSNSQQVNILFIGAMDYFPNEDGVLYFYKSIWPIVKSELPQARFYIVGSNPSNKIKIISKRDRNVIVTGYVNDIRDYLSMANIFVAPLRIARGVQNKVLEAMASGLPVVATPQAVQGLETKLHDKNGYLFIEDSPLKFTERIIVLTEKPLNGGASQKRELFLKQRYNWEENMALMERTVLGGQ